MRLIINSFEKCASAFVVFIGSVVFAHVSSAQTSPADDIAAHFYPTSVDQDFQRNHAPNVVPLRLTATAWVDLDRTGTDDYLAACYSDGMAAKLRLIKGSTVDNSILVTETPDGEIGGDQPLVMPVDVDNDGVPELVVEFARGTWIYKYANTHLTLISPTRQTPRGKTSALGSVAFADIDGSGALALLEYGLDDAAPDPYRIYRLVNGTFALSQLTALFTDRFEPEAGDPPVATRHFSATAGGSYTLRIVNGDQQNQYRVTSGELTINGATVVASNAWGFRTLVVPIGVLAQNTVTFSGNTDSMLSLTISAGNVP